MSLVIRPVEPSDWPRVERLFGSRGACGGCWCQHWHAPPSASAWNQAKGASNRAALRTQVEEGTCHAVIALEDDDVIGWCRFGPVETFPKLLRSRKLIRQHMAEWAVVCFFIAPPHRGRQLTTKLLQVAAHTAREHGAQSLEGYPVVTRGELPPAFAWTGFSGPFICAGFLPVDYDAGSRRIHLRELAG